MLELGETEAEGDSEAEAAVGAVITLPNILTKTAPATENKVAVPTAPEPVLPSNVMRL